MNKKSIVLISYFLLAAGLLCGAAVISGCAGLHQKNQFCESIPTDSYSLICQITDRIGTSPEAVGMALQLANLSVVDQLYSAQDADKFLADVYDRVVEFRANGATWKILSDYLLIQYNVLPKKVQMAIIILEDFWEIDDPVINLTVLSDYDWNRIEYRIKNLRAMLIPYIK